MKDFSQSDYSNYMYVVRQRIADIERGIESLDFHKMISGLSYEEWVKYQRGELDTKTLLENYKNGK